MPDVTEPSPELEALSRNVQRTFSEIVEQIPYLPEELQMAIANIDDPATLAHLIAGALRIGTEEKQKLLEEVDVAQRLRHLSRILARELEVVQLGTQIQTQVQSEVDKGQREFFLRQQMKAIQEELGEGDEQQAEANELREKIEAAELPEHALKAAERELSRLEKLPPAAAEHGVIRTYLEWLTELPWSKETKDNLDLAHARKVLDADHYDLEKIKDRILEYLAVRKLNPESPGPILCFVGPPGVGKTSLGKSIARALGREFERISVGGVRDEAEIRGHRRTYIGAMPGTIVRALRDAGSRNPVFMIDEIDKMGADFRGDPASAMLEVLDPAQNDSFRDHYLDLEFDLSDVVFIATANVLDTIPGPLLDRMETIELAGYTPEEKRHIARSYLVGRQIKANGLKPSQIEITDAALTAIIEEYTREAGVRNLERQIGTVCRKVARQVAEGKVEGQGPDLRQKSARAAGAPPRLRRAAAPDQRPRRRHRPRLDADRRRRPLHRGDRDAGLGQADDHRPARRGDEGVGAGGALLRARPLRRGRAEGRGRLVRQARRPRPRPGRGGAEGRPLGGRGDDRRALLADQRPAGSQQRGDDRRGDADRAGAADRRPQGEVAGGAAGRDQEGDRPLAQRGRRRRRSPSTSSAASSSSTSTRSPRPSPPPSPRWRPQASRGAAVARRRRGGARSLGRLLDRRRADRARRRPALRHPRGAELPPRRDRHRQPGAAGRLRPRDGRGRLLRVGAAALLRARLDLDAADRDRPLGLRSLSALAGVATIPVAFLLGRELRGRRAGLIAAALVAVNPMLIWYSQEARAYALLVLFCALSLLYCVRALRVGEGPMRRVATASATSSLGRRLRPCPRDPLLRRLPARRRGDPAAAPARAREPRRPLDRRPDGAVLAPLVIHQMSYGHAEWIGKFSLGHRIWETATTFVVGETGDIIGRPRAAGAGVAAAGPGPRRFALSGAAGQPPGEARRLRCRWRSARSTIGVPLLLALVSTSKDFVLARNLLPALVPLLLVVAIGSRSSGRGGSVPCSPRSSSPTPSSSRSAPTSTKLQRPDWQAVAEHLGEPEAPRATVTWALGEAPLRYYLSTGAIQLKPSEGYDWLVREIDFVSDGSTPPPPRRLLGPRLPRSRPRRRRPLFIRRYRLPGPAWRRCGCGSCATPARLAQQRRAPWTESDR